MGNWKYFKKMFGIQDLLFKIKAGNFFKLVSFIKINEFNLDKFSVCVPWMECKPGEGGKEIENQGRSRVIRFSQETGFTVRISPRIGVTGAQKRQVQDARDSLTQLPFFLFASPDLAVRKSL